MRTLDWIVFALALIAMQSLAVGSVEAQVLYSGPKCLGPVCFDVVASFEGLAEELGGPSSAGGVYGYRAENGQAFLILTDGGGGKVGSINLRDFSDYGMWNGRDGKQTAKDIRNWKTSEGIGLGSQEADVVKAYGKPSGVKDLELEDTDHKKGGKVLLYKGRLNGAIRAASLRIRDGRVSFIELENDAFVGPDCLGPYCTYGDLSLDSLLRRFRLAVPKNSRHAVECFQSRDGRASLHVATNVEETFGVADVLLSDFQNCLPPRRRPATNDLMSWKTPEGIGLGSPEEDVVKAYGTPSAIKKLDRQKPIRETKGLVVGGRAGDIQPQIGEKILVYGPRELQAADFGIRDGKVSYIWLKESDFWLKDGE